METAYSATKSGEAGNPTEPMLQGLPEFASSLAKKKELKYIPSFFMLVISAKICYYNNIWKMN